MGYCGACGGLRCLRRTAGNCTLWKISQGVENCTLWETAGDGGLFSIPTLSPHCGRTILSTRCISCSFAPSTGTSCRGERMRRKIQFLRRGYGFGGLKKCAETSSFYEGHILLRACAKLVRRSEPNENKAHKYIWCDLRMAADLSKGCLSLSFVCPPVACTTNLKAVWPPRPLDIIPSGAPEVSKVAPVRDYAAISTTGQEPVADSAPSNFFFCPFSPLSSEGTRGHRTGEGRLPHDSLHRAVSCLRVALARGTSSP